MSKLLASRKSHLLSFKGTVVANVTPLHPDGSVNDSIIGDYVKHLMKIGVKGAYVHGTTGEGVSLAHDEKIKLTKAWIDACRSSIKSGSDPFLLIINVSSNVVSESKEHAKFCNEQGVDGIAFLPPFYYRPANVSQLVQYMKGIASAAPDTPLVYYHFPEMTYVDFPLSDVLSQALSHVPSFTGLKYTNKDIVQLTNIQRDFGSKVKIFVGYEESVASAAAIGIDSGICAQFNFKESVDSFNRIVDNIGKDMGKVHDAQRQMHELASELKSGCFIANVKAKLSKQLDVGTVRPPLFQ